MLSRWERSLNCFASICLTGAIQDEEEDKLILVPDAPIAPGLYSLRITANRTSAEQPSPF